MCSIAGSTVSFIGVGTCVINANQAGNANFNPAPQVQQSFTVAKSAQTISFTSTAPANATVGGPTYTVTATATSGLAVTFTIDPLGERGVLDRGLDGVVHRAGHVRDQRQPGAGTPPTTRRRRCSSRSRSCRRGRQRVTTRSATSWSTPERPGLPRSRWPTMTSSRPGPRSARSAPPAPGRRSVTMTTTGATSAAFTYARRSVHRHGHVRLHPVEQRPDPHRPR